MYDAKESANIAHLIIEKLCGFGRIDAILNKQKILSVHQLNKLNDYTQQLTNNKPVQYVLNEAWFAGMKLYVDENVLIPRPETEELVEWIIQDIARFGFPVSGFRILDIGTGSGCIAIALKKKMPDTSMYAFDVSEEALKIAVINARENNMNINFSNTDILSTNEKNTWPLFDVIISNPPYIPQKESAEMQLNVLSYEPHVALFVPDENPLLFYKAISDFALLYLKHNGKLYFEINEEFADRISGLLEESSFHSIEIKKDLQGKNRMIKAVYNNI